MPKILTTWFMDDPYACMYGVEMHKVDINTD